MVEARRKFHDGLNQCPTSSHGQGKGFLIVYDRSIVTNAGFTPPPLVGESSLMVKESSVSDSVKSVRETTGINCTCILCDNL
jgi:hypothetical protein